MNTHLSSSELQLKKTDYYPEIDEIEGWDDQYSYGEDEHPIESVYIRQQFRTVREVVDGIKNDRFVLDSDLCRGEIWNEIQKSKLIESCIMQIPISVILAAEQQDGRIAIIDGVQRLSTLYSYLNKEFRLTFNSGNRHPLCGKRFNDLTIRLQERIIFTKLIVYILDSNTPVRSKMDIFDRVNSGMPFNRQQIRNALYCGPATNWLKSATESSAFKDATGGMLSSKNMRDREAVNRFVSFKLLGWENYEGNMDVFLADGLVHLNKLSNAKRKKLLVQFEKTMQLCHEIFGAHCFRNSIYSQNGNRSAINISLFDVISVSFCNNYNLYKNTRKNIILKHVKELLRDEKYVSSITKSTNSIRAVQFRHQEFENANASTECPTQ